MDLENNAMDHENAELPKEEEIASAAEFKASNAPGSGKPRLAWQAREGAVRYVVCSAEGEDGEFTLRTSTEELGFEDESAQLGKTYSYYVQGFDADGKPVWKSETASRTCCLPRPAVSIANKESSGKNKLSWEAVEGAVKYRVFVADAEKGEYARLGSTEKTEFTHVSAEPGKTYCYRVRAIHEDPQLNSALSKEKKRTCDLARPAVELKNDASTGKIKLTWEPVEGAEGYKVYRAVGADGEYALLKTTTETSYVHTAGKAGVAYYYQVKAVHSNSAANSVPSKPRYRTCDLGRTRLTVALNGSGKPKLSWIVVSKAVEYVVYVSEKANGGYEQLVSTSSTSVVHSAAKPGKKYYYKVVAAADAAGADSASSNVVSVLVK